MLYGKKAKKNYKENKEKKECIINPSKCVSNITIEKYLLPKPVSGLQKIFIKYGCIIFSMFLRIPKIKNKNHPITTPFNMNLLSLLFIIDRKSYQKRL